MNRGVLVLRGAQALEYRFQIRSREWGIGDGDHLRPAIGIDDKERRLGERPAGFAGLRRRDVEPEPTHVVGAQVVRDREAQASVASFRLGVVPVIGGHGGDADAAFAKVVQHAVQFGEILAAQTAMLAAIDDEEAPPRIAGEGQRPAANRGPW